MEALLVRATAHHAHGDVAAGMADLGRSLAAAVPAGYRRLFLDEGPVVRELLTAIARGRVELGRDEAATVLQQVDRLRTSPEGGLSLAPVGVQEALSRREVEVLQLLATNLTGPQIASRLFMSLNTFRTHTRHIFTKLDVTTRRGAVRRANSLDPS